MGRWVGGPGSSNDWMLTIDEEGNYFLLNREMGWADEGYIDGTTGRLEMYNATGDGKFVDAAGINGCHWAIGSSVGMTFLWFCGGNSTFLPS